MTQTFFPQKIFYAFFKGLSTTLQFVTELTSLFLKTSLWNGNSYMFPILYPFQGYPLPFLLKTKFHFSSSLCKQKSSLYWSLMHLALFFRLELNGCNTSRKILNDGPVLFIKLCLESPWNYVFRDPFFHLFFPLFLAPHNDMNNCKCRQENIRLILLILGPGEGEGFLLLLWLHFL